MLFHKSVSIHIIFLRVIIYIDIYYVAMVTTCLCTSPENTYHMGVHDLHI